MRLVALAILSCVVFCAPGWAKEDFSHPKYYLGYSDKEGTFCLWSDIVKVTVSDQISLPLRFKFDAAGRSGTRMFGRFWSCPLLEATLLPASESVLTFSTLGGRSVPLRLQKDGTHKSPNGQYTARTVSPDERLVTGDGWEYRFVSGKLRSAKTRTGQELEWVYLGSKLLSLNEKGKGALLTLEYPPDSPIPSAIVVDKTRYAIEPQKMPLVSVVTGQPVITGYEPSVAAIRSPFVTREFPVVLEPDGSLVMDHRSSHRPARKFIWDATTGQIKSDGEWTYTTNWSEEGVVLVSRKNTSGAVESYFYNSGNGTSEHCQPDGTVVTRLYFIAPGPTCNLIRKLAKIKDGKEIENRQWSYDEAGRLIRDRTGEYELAMSWHPKGTMAERTEAIGGKVLKKEVFDADSRLVEKTLKNRRYIYTYEGPRISVQKFEDGRLTSTRVFDAESKSSYFFLPESTGGLKPGAAFSALQAAPGSRDQEIAKSMAVRAIQTITHDE